MITLTDWRIRDEDLPDIPPGRECERAITPQKHVILKQIAIRNLKLVHLGIGAVPSVPFEIYNEDGALKIYRPAVPLPLKIVRLLDDCGARVCALDAIRVPAGMGVYLVLVNENTTSAKPYASLLVQEEK
jgi:hypothetical protein